MGMPEDLSGKKFGNLTVIKLGERTAAGRVRWNCLCDCGNKTCVVPDKLKSGHTKSCGCLADKEKRSRLQDLTGKKFTRLTVIKRGTDTKGGIPRWDCSCDCGNKSTVIGSKLKNGHTKSCGCLHGVAAKARTEDISGQTYNRLTVIRMAGYENNKALCRCQCECGNQKTCVANDVRSGHTKSCGCINKELAGTRNFKHGHRPKDKAGKQSSRTYRSWRAMKQRCYQPTQDSYCDYGGRGITVCDRWLNSFENFLEDMGVRPENHSIDRIDNNGNYCKDNCKWSTRSEQGLNTRVQQKKAQG